MSIYHEDVDDHLAGQSQEIFPEDLAANFPDISITSGSAENEAEVAASTQSSGKAAKIGVALLALAAVIFSAVIFGTSRPGRGPTSIADSVKIAKAIEFEPTLKPTVNNAALSTSAPTKAKAAKQPAIIPPTPSPTAEASFQATETVSTETTGPPTVTGREETRV